MARRSQRASPSQSNSGPTQNVTRSHVKPTMASVTRTIEESGMFSDKLHRTADQPCHQRQGFPK
eukprot:319062-Amphidinium_carterae.1